MGTRGLRVYRFHKRYYVFYNQYDSYPNGLGKQIIAEIPNDPTEYRAWLTSLRERVAKWEAEYEGFITIGPGNEIKHPWANHKTKESNEANEGGSSQEEEEEEVEQTPAYLEHEFPSFLAPVNDTYVEWIYTLDLDNEKLSVNNGAHFALEVLPQVNFKDWVSAMIQNSSGSLIVLPGVVPEEAVTDLVAKAEDDPRGDTLVPQLKGLTVDESINPKWEYITPKGITDIPWVIRHGAILRSLCFYLWSKAKEEVLATTLLQLTPPDLLFRELAFALLSLAAGGKNTTVLFKHCLKRNSAFGFVKKGQQAIRDCELFSVLGSGAHHEGESAGSAPHETVYWFENILIVLAAQLYRKGVAEKGVEKIAKFCQALHPENVVDAVLLSIEHVVLIHIIPARTGEGPEIQRSTVLPLFDIADHLSMHTKDRYSASHLSQLANQDDEKFQRRLRKKQRIAMSERMVKNEGISMSWGEDKDVSDDEEEEQELLEPTIVEGSTMGTFYALQHMFSSVARRRLRPNQQGCFPTEIYRHILSFVTDNATRDACLHTSLVLREICLREYLLSETEGLLLRPSDFCEECVDAENIPKQWSLLDMESGEESDVEFKFGGRSFLDYNTENDWTVMIGSEYGRKSLLPEITFKFPEC